MKIQQRPRTGPAHMNGIMPQPCMRSIISFLEGSLSMPDFKCRYDYWDSYRILQMAAVFADLAQGSSECRILMNRSRLHGNDAVAAVAGVVARDLSILYRLSIEDDIKEMVFVRSIAHVLCHRRNGYDPDLIDDKVVRDVDRPLTSEESPQLHLGGFVHNMKQVVGESWKQALLDNGEQALDGLWEYCHRHVSGREADPDAAAQAHMDEFLSRGGA